MSLLHIFLVPGGRIFYLFICHVIFAQIIGCFGWLVRYKSLLTWYLL